jgi:cephalosporin hydroxylase
MKFEIDTESNTLTYEAKEGEKEVLDLYSKESFEILSRYWVKVGWNQKHIYTFSWFGRPIIQLPEDIIRMQEVIYRIKPDVIIETGVAHGGSLIFYASLCKAVGKGRVIGIDIDIRQHNRIAIEQHELFSYITLLEGSSTSSDIVSAVDENINQAETVLVILDSNHSKQHVLDELEAYNNFVTKGSYIVATDGIMRDLHDVPRGERDWEWDNPSTAAMDFLETHDDFVLEIPEWSFNESNLNENITHWPNAWLKRV